MKNGINICLACDDNYAEKAAVVMASILKNASTEDQLHFYILEKAVSTENKKLMDDLRDIKDFNLEFIEPDPALFEEYSSLKTTDHITIPAYYRLKLASLLPQVEKIIYLDCDVIVQKSLSELFNTDLGENYIAGVLDVGHKRLSKKAKLEIYVNSGVLLINLEKWRADAIEERLLMFTAEHKDGIFLGDQEVLNRSLEGKVLLLPFRWNVQVINFVSRSYYKKDFYILHYIGGSKPWLFGSYIPLREKYYEYLKLTGLPEPNSLWHVKSNILGFFRYTKHRPFFMFRLGFIKGILSNIL